MCDEIMKKLKKNLTVNNNNMYQCIFHRTHVIISSDVVTSYVIHTRHAFRTHSEPVFASISSLALNFMNYQTMISRFLRAFQPYHHQGHSSRSSPSSDAHVKTFTPHDADTNSTYQFTERMVHMRTHSMTAA